MNTVDKIKENIEEINNKYDYNFKLIVHELSNDNYMIDINDSQSFISNLYSCNWIRCLINNGINYSVNINYTEVKTSFNKDYEKDLEILDMFKFIEIEKPVEKFFSFKKNFIELNHNFNVTTEFLNDLKHYSEKCTILKLESERKKTVENLLNLIDSMNDEERQQLKNKIK